MSVESNEEDWTLVNQTDGACRDSTEENGLTRESHFDAPLTGSKVEVLLDTKENGESKMESSETMEEDSAVQDHSIRSHSSCDSSDIERISDEGMESFDLVGSEHSHMSDYSFVKPRDAEADVESLLGSESISVVNEDTETDLSVASSLKDEPLPNLDAKCVVRSYTHTPNRKLNWALNVLMILSATMVFGLGIGHFIGWSSQWMQRSIQEHAQVTKLKALQDELNRCLQNPGSSFADENGEMMACYDKVDYWRNRYESMLAENHVLQSVVSHTEDEDETCEEVSKQLLTEYRQLKFHLIAQQLENVATLKRLEELKQQKMETLNRVKDLQLENDELKTQVADEIIDDVLDEVEIKLLRQENAELKDRVAGIDLVAKADEASEKEAAEKVGDLRQQINQLKVENAELQRVIAKLRYGQPPPFEDATEKQETVEKGMSGSWLVDSMPDLNITGFLDYLAKVATDKETVQKELIQLRENLQRSYDQLSEQARKGLTTGTVLLSDFQKSVLTKWQEMTTETTAGLPTEAFQKMSQLLMSTVRKLYVLGSDAVSESNLEGFASKSSAKFQRQVDKLLLGLEEKWASIKSKVWGEKLPTTAESTKKPDEKTSESSESTKRLRPKILFNPLLVSRLQDDEEQEVEWTDGDEIQNDRSEQHSEDTERSTLNDQRKIIVELKPSKKREEDVNANKPKAESKTRKKMREDEEPKDEEAKTVNRTAEADSVTGDWQFKRAQTRENSRRVQRESDWLFDRAHNRKKSREQAEEDGDDYPYNVREEGVPNKVPKKARKTKKAKSEENLSKKSSKKKQRRSSEKQHSSADDDTEDENSSARNLHNHQWHKKSRESVEGSDDGWTHGSRDTKKSSQKWTYRWKDDESDTEWWGDSEQEMKYRQKRFGRKIDIKDKYDSDSDDDNYRNSNRGYSWMNYEHQTYFNV